MPHRPSRQYWPRQAETPFLQNSTPALALVDFKGQARAQKTRGRQQRASNISHRRQHAKRMPSENSSCTKMYGGAPKIPHRTLHRLHTIVAHCGASTRRPPAATAAASGLPEVVLEPALPLHPPTFRADEQEATTRAPRGDHRRPLHVDDSETHRCYGPRPTRVGARMMPWRRPI